MRDSDFDATFSALYERYAIDVYRFALGLSGNASDAEDIVSETFTRVWTSTQPVRSTTVRSYLFTIARNVYLHGLRRTRREAPNAEVAATAHDPRPTPEQHAAARSSLHALSKSLARLKEQDRSALLLHVVHDLGYAEIASMLGISVANVKIKIHRARISLAHLREEQP